MSQYHDITISQYHNVKISQYLDIAISKYYNITISQYYINMFLDGSVICGETCELFQK